MDKIPPACTLCGRPIGPKLLNCRYRPTGGCPYEAANPAASTGSAGCMVGMLLFLGVWLGGATLGFTSILLNSRSLVSSLLSLGALALFWLFGLFGLGVVLFGLFGKNITLYHPASGVLAKYATIFGWTFGSGVSTGWVALPPELMQLSLSVPLRYPASWSAWVYATDSKNSGGLATFICAATLLTLAAHKQLELKKTTTHDTLAGLINRHSQRYMFAPLISHPPAGYTGLLEQKILDLFVTPPPHLQSAAWIPGTPLEAKEIIAAIYDKDRTQPEKWLIELVEADMLASGVARREKGSGPVGWLTSKVTPEMSHQQQLEAEYQRLRTWHEQLRQAHPDFIKTLHTDIERAFKERTDSSD